LRVGAFDIANFRSVKRISLANLGNFVVLIGQNGGGKSNILEGLSLFFQFFEWQGGKFPNPDEFLWFNRNRRDPAVFKLEIVLDEAEAKEIFASPRVEAMKAVDSGLHQKLELERILSQDGSWQTSRIVWGTIPLVEKDEVTTPDEWNLMFAELIRADVTSIAMQSGQQQAGSVSTKAESTPAWQASSQALSQMLGKLSTRLKQMFKLVPAVRDVKQPDRNRLTVVDPAIQSSLWTLDQSTKPEEEETFASVERTFEGITGERYDAVGGAGYVRRGARRFPLPLQGGGVQAALNLSYQIVIGMEASSVLALEEPELHSHPSLQRRVFGLLAELSRTHQIFVVTHSTVFVDKSNPGSTWLVRMSDQEGTQVTPLTDWDQLVSELGLRPSDVFFADKIIMVEGATDQIFIESAAKAVGLDFSGVQVIPVAGSGEMLGKVRLASRLFSHASRIHVLLDADARDVAETIRSEAASGRLEIHTLAKGAIEDYYPAQLIDKSVERLDETYGLGIRSSEVWARVKEGKLKIQELDLGHKALGLAGGWKVILGREVSTLLRASPELVPEEIRRFVENVVRSR